MTNELPHDYIITWGNGEVAHKPYPSAPHRRTDVKGTSPLLPPLPPSPQIMDSPLSTTSSHPYNQVQDNRTPCVFVVPRLRTSSLSTSALPSSLVSATPSTSTISLWHWGRIPIYWSGKCWLNCEKMENIPSRYLLSKWWFFSEFTGLIYLQFTGSSRCLVFLQFAGSHDHHFLIG